MPKKFGFVTLVVGVLVALIAGVTCFYITLKNTGSWTHGLFFAGGATVIAWGIIQLVLMAISAVFFGSDTLEDEKPSESEAEEIRKRAMELRKDFVARGRGKSKQ